MIQALESFVSFSDPISHLLFAMPGPIGRVVKLVSGGIGLAVEAHENHKQKKAQEQARTQGHGSNAAESSSVGASREAQPFDPDEPPPEYIETTDEHAEELIAQGKAVPVDSKDVKRDLKKKEDFGSDSDSDSDINDEGEWALDDAAEAADPPSYDEVTRQMSSNSLAEEVTRLAGPVAKAHHKIPYSVILPQRRPRDKGRGFVRAYAPVLNEVGITQQTFITFQKNWLKASQVRQFSRSMFEKR